MVASLEAEVETLATAETLAPAATEVTAALVVILFAFPPALCLC